jgi:hypothetical protein
MDFRSNRGTAEDHIAQQAPVLDAAQVLPGGSRDHPGHTQLIIIGSLGEW